METTEPSDFSLRREPACWVLVFNGRRAYLKHEIGIEYVAWLLAHPRETIASAALFAKFSARRGQECPSAYLPDPETGELQPITDGVGSGQLTPGQEEAEARKLYTVTLREIKATMDDAQALPSERAEAERRYEELVTFLTKHYRPAPAPGRAVTKLVHKSIQRLCEHLALPATGQTTADPAARAFGDYIAARILVPSRRYTRAKAGADTHLARGELAGKLVFECPAGHRWTVVL